MAAADIRAAVAELVGTFFFMLFGYFAVTSTTAFAGGGTPDLLVIAFGFGLGLFAAIHVAGAVSGGHFNPAVTVAALADGRVDAAKATAYIVAQVVGAIAAALVLGAIFDQAAVQGVITAPGHGVTDVEALVLETLFTAIFLTVILTASKRAATQASFIIALTLTVIHLALVPFTGSSVNPARSIAPALVGGDVTSLWIYIVGPVVGGLIGWAIYRYLTPPETAAA